MQLQNHRGVKYIPQFIACKLFYAKYISLKMLKTGFTIEN